MKEKAVVLLSGGLDSATVLAMAREQGFVCHALSIRYGQRHAAELAAARRVAEMEASLAAATEEATAAKRAEEQAAARSASAEEHARLAVEAERATAAPCRPSWAGEPSRTPQSAGTPPACERQQKAVSSTQQVVRSAW